MPTHSCFSSSIKHKKILTPKADKVLWEQLNSETLSLSQSDIDGQDWSIENYPNGYTSYSSVDQLHLSSPSFKKLEQLISKEVLNFCKELDFDLKKPKEQIYIQNMWLNVNSTNSYHSMHLHPGSTISGTFYLQCPKGSGQLKFENPLLDKKMACPPRKAESSKNPDHLYFSPKAGYIILFESFLRHEVECHQALKERVSISFNYHWRE